MDPRRLAFGLLTTAGVAVGHIVGYALAHPDAAAREAALGGHAYFAGAASFAVPIGVVTALVWAVRTCRDLDLGASITVRRLALAQIGVFAVQEIGERYLAGGVSPAAAVAAAATERGVWFGLVAQILVAWSAVRAIDVVRRVVRFATRSAVVVRRAVSARRAAVAPRVLVPVMAVVAVGLRAPPVVGHPH